jgi:aspartate carbamoyltransferase regulatory chain, allosteric domain
LLGLKNSLDPVTIGYNLPSKKIGKKGIIKITNRFFSQEEISRLSVVAPKIVLNIIKDYEVAEKKTVELPEELRGIVKCNNPKCITNNEPMQTVFNVTDKAQGILKCRYCDKEQDINNIKLC